MVTAAEIQSIDFTSNSCVVRIPFFETVNSVETFTLEAKFCIQPGIYNGYQVGDTVWVGFIDGIMGKPIVLGKVYHGAKEEEKLDGGSTHAADLVVSNSAKLPKNTTFEDVDKNYNSIPKLVDAVKTANLSNGEPKTTTLGEINTNELWIDGKPIFKQIIVYEGKVRNTIVCTLGRLASIPDTVIKIDYVFNATLNGTSINYIIDAPLGETPTVKNIAVRVAGAGTPSNPYYVVQLLSEQDFGIVNQKVIATVYYTKK